MSNSERLSVASTIVNSQQPLIEACQAGDIDTLKRLLSSHIIEEDSSPSIQDLFAAAAKHKQADTIRYLSSQYKKSPLSYRTTAAGFNTADPATLRALLEHDPSIADYEENYSTKLFDFCHGSDPTIPLLLLEHGADPDTRPNPLCLPLVAAAPSQPMELIAKLVASGAPVTDSAIKAASDAKRADVVEFLQKAK